MTVGLPKDAKGRDIPLDTECPYTCDGEKREATGFTCHRRKDRWGIMADTHTVDSIYLHPTPPDSLEKPPEDSDAAGGAIHGAARAERRPSIPIERASEAHR